MSLFVKSSVAPSSDPRSVFGAAAAQSKSVFGAATAPSTGIHPKSVFGGSTQQTTSPKSVFGAPAQPSTTNPKSLFGKASTQSSSVHPQSMFNKQGSNKSLFGASVTQNTAGTANPGTVQPATRSLFGSNKAAASSIFHSSPASVSSAGTNAATASNGVNPRSLFTKPSHPQQSSNQARSLFTNAAKSQSVFGGQSQASAQFPSQQQTGSTSGSLFVKQTAAGSNTLNQANTQPTTTQTVFGKPTALFGKQTGPNTDSLDFIFTLLKDLSVADKNAYESPAFELGCIPINPPPREFSQSG